ncbi:DNA-binding transcriptional regulator, MarR family [Andreprevotia lacus DSM 23236]|jgi:DNA-binding MarR family transcriptional regulator|uniref:DNA-binding transcriptional regulator, MarR family n=1 Tax=Andreprevotia lacus DSM 23236 TaxID=1121001 RepID=A0A1W1XQE3_9NEIS|nr:MarR family transcriptional regulator [Andreprevotia lacus]SMC26075.1 DNA-binding transcriptional regulator, MarR family [Andreprevotia lacus DSM 23236]
MTDPLLLNQQLCFPLYAASNMLTRAYRPLLDALGITYPQYLVMLALWERAPRSVGELGKELYLDSGTLTPLLKRMEALGLVTRQRASDDERRVDIHLTDAGRALRTQAEGIPGALACQLPFPDLPALREQLQQLVGVLAQADTRNK